MLRADISTTLIFKMRTGTGRGGRVTRDTGHRAPLCILRCACHQFAIACHACAGPHMYTCSCGENKHNVSEVVVDIYGGVPGDTGGF